MNVGEEIPGVEKPLGLRIVSLTYERLANVSNGTYFVSRWSMRTLIALILTCVGFFLVSSADAQAQPVGAYPEDLYKPDLRSRVINGCGPEFLMVNTEKRFGDAHSYRFGGDGQGEYVTYTVNFRDSCNLHDVGYQGRYFAAVDGQWVSQPLVYDKILGQYVDYTNASRAQVDAHFWADMQAQCEQQIRQQFPETTYGREATRTMQDRAIALCKGDTFGYVGAGTMYSLVRTLGRSAYTEGPSQQRVRDSAD